MNVKNTAFNDSKKNRKMQNKHDSKENRADTVTNHVLEFLHSVAFIYEVFPSFKCRQKLSTQCFLVVHVYDICQICFIEVKEISNRGVHSTVN